MELSKLPIGPRRDMLLQLPTSDVLHLCYVNREMKAYCNDEELWRLKANKFLKGTDPAFTPPKAADESWKTYFIEIWKQPKFYLVKAASAKEFNEKSPKLFAEYPIRVGDLVQILIPGEKIYFQIFYDKQPNINTGRVISFRAIGLINETNREASLDAKAKLVFMKYQKVYSAFLKSFGVERVIFTDGTEYKVEYKVE